MRSPYPIFYTIGMYAMKRRKPIPFEFVLDALSALEPVTRPMFGCLAVYVGRKIVLILRDKAGHPDSGVWLATTTEHHQSLRGEFPHMRSIGVLGKAVTGWQVLPSEAPDFEEAALHACELVLARDPRIGKVPKTKKPRKPLDPVRTKATGPARHARQRKQSLS
jgi:hypothetical protein